MSDTDSASIYPLPDLPVSLPSIPIPEFIDVDALSNYFNSSFEVLGEAHFLRDAVWRDTLVMTGTMRTFYSAQSIAAAWKDTAATHKPTNFQVTGKPRVHRAGDAHWVNIQFKFETQGLPAIYADGLLSVVPDKDGIWKIWVMRTIITDLVGQPKVDKLEPTYNLNGEKLSNGTNGHSEQPTDYTTNGTTSSGTLTNGESKHGVDFEAVVIGGGQAGLSVGGRLKALGVKYVVLDKYEEVGDSWAKRYDSTRLHTVREFAHLPFERTFPATYQEWLVKDDLAKGHREWVKKFDINIWQSTTVLSGTWIAEKAIWELKLLRHGEEKTITCSYVTLAVGANSRFPIAPTYENREAFKGLVLHSSEYTNSKGWAGKHGIVVGSGNTAHDVADDMERAGLASVTMVQRNPTFVIPVDLYRETHDLLYNERIPTEFADMMFFTGPSVLTPLLAGKMLHAKIRANPDRFDALEKAGFLLDRYADMGKIIFVKQGGHYMDVGTSGKIAQGLIKMQTDSLPVRWVEDGLVCADGHHLKADVVLFATGFVGNMRLLVAELLGTDTAAQVQDFWGLDAEGELRGAFKPSGHPAFWYTGGAIGQARYMSRHIALQIKAKVLGTPLPMYTQTPPRNNSPQYKKLPLVS
ncbi:uncharacterized protein Z520_02818 [Fonsecaea multimorphosa CBS 102226]|uniref:FAD/NAD(P)-binding domain-containing protein n=1 Tax=Fonsecaea multimorphosa CBS 102226 TaxID=1442371 RepID=A0A0D2HH69_9EURO|nr:uncharacterized protein Z520_02818 [Fonsecaea multimorphosa CBS 102226]KIY01266.1 hypothetical protein Z520_02818 [Fonsecaea multimorphosa CBS 102226]